MPSTPPTEWPEFCSPAYKLEVPSSASSEMINIYPELIEQGPRAGKFRMRGIPGLKSFTQLSQAPVRQLFATDGGNRMFAAGGNKFFEVHSDQSIAGYTGSFAAGTNPVIIAANGFQLVAASGGFLHLIQGGNPGTVTQLNFTDGTPITAGSVAFLDNYFIAALVNSKQIFVSNLAPAGGTWDPGDTAFKEGYPDNIARVWADNEQLWLFGFETLEIWTDTAGLFPFSRIPGAVYNIGCSAPFSVAGAEGYRFWLWNNKFYGAFGQNPTRISDYGVEEDLKTFPTTADCEGWCQISGGHVWYVAQFPAAQKTWVYDLANKAWHRRAFFSMGQYSQYRGRVYAHAFGKDFVGDSGSQNIYQLDPNTFTDAGGVPLRRQRVCPYLTQQNRNIRYNQLILDMAVGVGLSGLPLGTPGVDPQLIMRYSDNRGFNWSNERQVTIGGVGQFSTRVIFNQNGASRIGKTFDLVFTDPCDLVYNAAYLRLGMPEAGH